MPLFELKAEVVSAVVPLLEELLTEREEQNLIVLEDGSSDRAWLTGYYKSRERTLEAWDKLAAVMPAYWFVDQPQVRVLADTDWKDSYKTHFKAWKFGRLNWVPIWESADFALPPNEEVLWLDPGMAFGTGNHETTRLLVERLTMFTEQNGVNGRVIDAGSGSGILALSAAKLGYRKVVAFDNDPLAIDVGRENAKLNGLKGYVCFFVGDLATGLTGLKAELILANVQADVLIKHARKLLNAMAPSGMLAMSGILLKELGKVRSTFEALAPSWAINSKGLGEWSDLVITRSD